ncbi:MAG: hypothetical protein HZA08_01635 [Nitrospirae bacterium]|nr:hypothetical protein [Nitrospirota bacterium]
MSNFYIPILPYNGVRTFDELGNHQYLYGCKLNDHPIQYPGTSIFRLLLLKRSTQRWPEDEMHKCIGYFMTDPK